MRLVEFNHSPEDHFTEGELDLEAPEEQAISELDYDAMLEEDLDNEDLAEEDVDEATLEVTLEDLVHSDGAEGALQTIRGGLFAVAPELEISLRPPEPGYVDGHGSRPPGYTAGRHELQDLDDGVGDGGDLQDLDDLDDLEVADLEDLEESLDHILAERLAGDQEAPVEEYEDDTEVASAHDGRQLLVLHPAGQTASETLGCREDEFLCRSCFLVRKRAQLADVSGSICRDCSG